MPLSWWCPGHSQIRATCRGLLSGMEGFWGQGAEQLMMSFSPAPTATAASKKGVKLAVAVHRATTHTKVMLSIMSHHRILPAFGSIIHAHHFAAR